MKRLRYKGHAHTSTYQSSDLPAPVVVGQEIEVPEAVAARLLDDHGDAFEDASIGHGGPSTEPGAAEPAPVASPVDRMVAAAPVQKKATKRKPTTRKRATRSRKPKGD